MATIKFYSGNLVAEWLRQLVCHTAPTRRSAIGDLSGTSRSPPTLKRQCT